MPYWKRSKNPYYFLCALPFLLLSTLFRNYNSYDRLYLILNGMWVTLISCLRALFYFFIYFFWQDVIQEFSFERLLIGIAVSSRLKFVTKTSIKLPLKWTGGSLAKMLIVGCSWELIQDLLMKIYQNELIVGFIRNLISFKGACCDRIISFGLCRYETRCMIFYSFIYLCI